MAVNDMYEKNADATEYQVKCMEAVWEKLCEGERRLSVLSDHEEDNVSLAVLLVEKVCQKYQRVFFAFNESKQVENAQKNISDRGNTNISCGTPELLSETEIQYDMVVLFDIRAAKRAKLEEVFTDDDRTIIVSVFICHYDEAQEKHGRIDYLAGDLLIEMQPISERARRERTVRLYTYIKRLYNIPFVYVTGKLIDIRDIFTAPLEERNSLVEQLERDEKRLENDINFALAEIEGLSDDNDMQMLKKMMKKMKGALYFQKCLLDSAGFSEEVVAQEFENIMKLRTEFLSKIEGAEEDSEQEIAWFETSVAERIRTIIGKCAPKNNYDRYEDILRDCVTEKVWAMLDDASKSFLITAKMEYDSLHNRIRNQELDCASVCLLISKALDLEISKRLYGKYADYLKKNVSMDCWPKALVDKKKNKLIEANEFTLGTVRYVVGCDKEGKIVDVDSYQIFDMFAKTELYLPDISDEQRKLKIKDLVKTVERVRTTYRNPAAHRNRIHIFLAKECLEYVIEKNKKLTDILEYMIGM